MFVYSVKTSKAKIAALIIALAAVIIAIALIMTGDKEPAANDSAVNYKAENAAEREECGTSGACAPSRIVATL